MTQLRILFVATLILLITSHTNAQDCGCDFTIPAANSSISFDGIAKGVQPGDVICLASGLRQRIIFTNLVGSADNYITIKNCGGQTLIGGPDASNGMLITQQSRYIHITGTGDPNFEFGIKVIETKINTQGIAAVGMSSDFEIDHIEITKVGFAGIMIKTDPTCESDDQLRPNFNMENIIIHDNYFHDLRGEGVYLGNSFFNGTDKYCGRDQYPHEVRKVRIYDNLFENTGWEAIQVGSAVEDVWVWNNRIYGYGIENKSSQNGGIQMGVGTTGRCFNNFIKGGGGPAMRIQGIGELYIYNNILISPGEEAININTRATPLATDIVPNGYLGGVYIINNTIIDAQRAAFKENLNDAPGNVMFNNLIVASTSSWDQTKGYLDWIRENNVVIPNLADAKFVNPAADDYRLLSGSPAIDAGRDVSLFGIDIGFDSIPRPGSGVYDVGAFEIEGSNPIVSTGSNQTIYLPTNSLVINGSASDPNGNITSYLWTKISGGNATLVNETTANLTINNLVEGSYIFQLLAIDNEGNPGSDEVTLVVMPEAVNQSPIANAGEDITLTLPTNSINLNGTGSDPDGSINSYSWIKVSGPNATLNGTNSSVLSLSSMEEGVFEFQLEVSDNEGSTDTDEISIIVFPVGTNQDPTANAGSDKAIVLPTNNISITGSGLDPDGTISSYNWSKKSGGIATLTNANSPTVSITDLEEGVYTFLLNVTDNNGGTASDEVTVTVSGAGSNTVPFVRVDEDIVLQFPANSTPIGGAAGDADGTIQSLLWIKVSGPFATLTNTSSSTVIVSDLLVGSYVFRLIATDNLGGTGSDDINVIVSDVNQLPQSDAGEDKIFNLPANTAIIIGSGTDSDGSIVTYNWSQISGISTSLSGDNTATLMINNLQAGISVFELTVIDNDGGIGRDQIQITVIPETVNQSPTVSTPSNLVIKLPSNSINVLASAADADGSISSYLWSKKSGPTATLSGTNTEILSLTELVIGNYVFNITVSDNLGAEASDEVNIIVTDQNLLPIVTTDEDATITLPNNSINILATANDQDGTISTYVWTKDTGPTSTLTNESTSIVSISNMVEGSYIFRITVTDNDGGISFDLINIKVQSATNMSPIANAGLDLELFLPNNSVIVKGTASDLDGTVVSSIWSNISSPGNLIIDPNSLAVSITTFVAGEHNLRLTVTDNEGAIGIDDVIIIVNPISSNQAPIVNAPEDITLTLPLNTTNLIGSASDVDGTIATIKWTKLSGPTATLQNTQNLILGTSDLIEGTYIFSLEVTDNEGASSSDAVNLIVLPEFVNQSPSVDAGNDRIITLPLNTIIIEGNAEDIDGSIESILWTKELGPNASLSGETTSTLTLTNLVVGEYSIKITVSDNNGAFNTDFVNIIVQSEGINQPPYVDAGNNINIFLPTNTVLLEGVTSDLDGTITLRIWEKIIGGTATLSNSNSNNVTISDLEAGEYTFRLTVTDDDGEKGEDDVKVTILPETVNQSPVANAGPNKSIVLPNNTTTLTGSGFDTDGSITSFSWSQISGSSVSLGNVDNANLTITGLTEGDFIFQLSVEDNEGSTSIDQTQVTVVSEGTNIPPISDAGIDMVLNLPENTLTLNGSGTDSDGTISSYIWTKSTGPLATLSNIETNNLSLSNLEEGTYVFILNVTDNQGASNSDETTVIVIPESVNKNPTVNLEPDITLRLPNTSIVINGTASDSDGSIISTIWTQITGATVTINGENTLSLEITDLVEGGYIFRLTAEDNDGAIGSKEISLSVIPEANNSPPQVFAGQDKFLLFPENSATIIGSAFDVDGSIKTVIWTKESGGNVSMADENSLNLLLANLEEGEYIFQLSATDNEGATSSDFLSVNIRTLNSLPIAIAGNDTTLILPNNILVLEGIGLDEDGGIVDYLWEKIEGPELAINIEDNPSIGLSQMIAGTYVLRLTVTDNDNGQNSDEITISIIEENDIVPTNLLDAPKFFTPNNDGINEYWEVGNLDDIIDCVLIIFNRLGNKVYEKKSYDNTWNGTVNGQQLPEGDYYYIITCADSSDNVFSGAIRIIR